MDYDKTIENYEFGKPYKGKIPIDEAEKFAYVFGEGSPALTELIKYCILNNIVTYSSCKGHPENTNILDRIAEYGYITFHFDMNYDSDDFAYFLASIPSMNKKIYAHLESTIGADRTITLYVPAKIKGESEKYFIYILDQLKKYKQMKDNNQTIYINPDIKKIVDYMFYSFNEYEAFDITQSSYKKYERQGIYIKKVATCPSYNKTDKLHTKFGMYLQSLRNKFDGIDDFVNYIR